MICVFASGKVMVVYTVIAPPHYKILIHTLLLFVKTMLLYWGVTSDRRTCAPLRASYLVMPGNLGQ